MQKKLKDYNEYPYKEEISSMKQDIAHLKKSEPKEK